MEEAVLAGVDAGSTANDLGLLARLHWPVASARRLGSLVVLGLGCSGDADAAVLLQLANASAQLHLKDKALDESLKVLRSLQLGKHLVSLDELALLLWPLALVCENLICQFARTITNSPSCALSMRDQR